MRNLWAKLWDCFRYWLQRECLANEIQALNAPFMRRKEAIAEAEFWMAFKRKT